MRRVGDSSLCMDSHSFCFFSFFYVLAHTISCINRRRYALVVQPIIHTFLIQESAYYCLRLRYYPRKAIVPNISGPSGSFIGRERQTSRTATLPLPDKTVGVFCLYDENELTATSAVTEGIEVIQEEQADLAIKNGTGKDSSTHSQEKKGVELRVTDLEKGQESNEFSFSNPAFQTDGRLDIVCDETVGNLDEDSGTQPPPAVHSEQTKKGNEFSFSNPAFISEDKQSTDGDIPRERSQSGGDSLNEELMEERQSNRSDSSGSSEGYASSPETDSVSSIECDYVENEAQTEKSEYRKQEISAADYTSPQTRPGSVTKGSDTSYCGISVIIEEVNEHETKNSSTIKTWTDWFKTPMFYKVFKRTHNIFSSLTNLNSYCLWE